MNPEIEARVDNILKQLTLQEKCALLSGQDDWHTIPIPRLGIKSLVMSDGPHGVRATPDGGRIFSPSTSFPTGVSMAATWDPGLIEKVGKALAKETLALGCEVLLGPCVNIVRHPLAGRNFESYSEDPYLAGRIGVAWVKGLQSEGVGASLKHFACNNQEDDRTRGSSEVDERTLREIYLAQFEAIVKEGDPWTVMCSYNRINGDYASQNRHTLKDILKGEWGYEGVVVSDWGANHTIFESIEGGLDLEMPGPAKYYGNLLVEAVLNWQIDEKYIDDAVRRVLRMLVRSGILDWQEHPAGELNTPAHTELARQVAEESITLLKNADGILPLDLAGLKSIAVIGPMATEAAIGGGGSSFVRPPYVTPVLDAIKELVGSDIRIDYAQGCDNFIDAKLIKDERFIQAVEIAKNADIALIFAGWPEGHESEGHDRESIFLTGLQDELISAVSRENPRTVVVLNCGSPVAMPWIELVAGVVEAYYPGMEGGRAVTNILLGKVNPSGKLTVTFPKKIEDTPAFGNFGPGREVLYGEGIYVGYRHYDHRKIEPLFPFGHGLSYTTFEYRSMKVTETGDASRPVLVSVSIKNTGNIAGKEIVQLYIGDPEASLPRPPKELKAFEKVSLQPGESKTLEFRLSARAFSFYDPVQKDWIMEPGIFQIMVGSSASDIRVQEFFDFK